MGDHDQMKSTEETHVLEDEVSLLFHLQLIGQMKHQYSTDSDWDVLKVSEMVEKTEGKYRKLPVFRIKITHISPFLLCCVHKVFRVEDCVSDQMLEICDKATGHTVRMSSKPITGWNTLNYWQIKERESTPVSKITNKKSGFILAVGTLSVWELLYSALGGQSRWWLSLMQINMQTSTSIN